MFWIILIIILLILAINWSNSSNSRRYTSKNEYKSNANKYSTTRTSYVSVKRSPLDKSIIDVSGSSSTIRNENLTKSEYKVPTWAHQYVYSYSEINGASTDQKLFYDFFKSRFLNGVYLDVEGNSNYYFILLFDLLEEYENHKNITKLESQMDCISKYYPKTRPYAKKFLIEKMHVAGYQEGIDRVTDKVLTVNNFTPSYYEYDYLLGKRYKDKLSLSPQEVSWLNKIWNPTNVFLDIEYCLLETIKLYLIGLKSINSQFKKQNTTITKEIESILTEVQSYYSRDHKSYWGSYDKSYIKRKAENEVFSTVFKRAENSIRESYFHKRKVSDEFPYSDEKLRNEFESRIGQKINIILKENISLISKPDEKADVELNGLNPTRWKIQFDELAKSFSKENLNLFIEGISKLENSNIKNPSIEQIFYEASKFIANYDRILSLSYYIKYIHYDLKSDRIDNKQLTKTIQKSLFNNTEQLHEFESTLASFITSRDLNKAIESIPKIYEPKRKKIIISKEHITEVQKQDKESVQILSEYLTDDYDDENLTLKSSEINSEELKIEIISKAKEEIKKVEFPEIQLATIELFKRNAYYLSLIDIESFCQTNGVLRNQLIDSINERCFEILDDLLIEEDDDKMKMNEEYYTKVIQS